MCPPFGGGQYSGPMPASALYSAPGMDAPTPATRFLDACRARPVDRPPVWMMRQAGRYLPEYREVRQGVSFMELCRSVDLATEVSLQPFRRFSPDAVIFFSDILVPVAAMGARVEFGDAGPDLPEPVRDAADVARLARFDPAAEIAFTGEILSRIRREVAGRAAVLGFCGAPWTLASYLVEGGGSKSFAAIKTMMGREPATLRRLLDLLADVVVRRPVLPARLGGRRRAALRHVGRRARARGLPGMGPPRRRARHRRHPARRGAGHPLRERLRAPDRGDGRVGRRRALDRLAPAAVRGAAAASRQAPPGQPRSGAPPGRAGRGRPAHARDDRRNRAGRRTS